jgi:hypothetical protein
MFLIGCGPNKNETSNSSNISLNNTNKVIVMNGIEYTLRHPGRVDADGKRWVPLYEKKGDNKSWWTPSLSGNNMVPIAF